jgi:hypothetical protein
VQVLGAQLVAQAQAVELGQHDVQYDQVVGRRGGQGQAVVAIVRDVYCIAVFFEAALEDAGQFMFVFNNQDAHGFQLRMDIPCAIKMKLR